MFTVEIAGVPIAIDNHFGLVELMCRSYLTDKEPLFTVSPSKEELFAEGCSSLAYAEQLCVYRHIALAMPDYDAFLMHAAVISIDGEGLAFAARSGTGKTTRVLLWEKTMGSRVRVINGDKPILRFTDGGLYAYGTPWMGKEKFGENTRAALRYVCFLERDDEVSLTKLDSQKIIPWLFRQVLLPKEEEKMDRFIELLERFVRAVPFFLLRCNREKEDPEAIWEQIKSYHTYND